MLNENVLGKILGCSLPDLQINDIHWKAQESTEDSILFYRLGDEIKSHTLFEERIWEAKFKWLIVNKAHPALPKNATLLAEDKWPSIQKAILDILYPLPTLKLMALTGTNGKTTTTDLVLQLGELLGKRGLSIGTLGVRENHKTILDFGLTSPSFIDLRKFIFTYGKDKDFCVMEASSHALAQDRLHGLQFDSAGWLSFSQDHLDYHQTMDAYFEAKCLIFNHLKTSAKLFIPSEQKDLFSQIKKVSSQATQASIIADSLPVFFSAKFNRNNLEVALAMIKDAFQTTIIPDYQKLKAPDGRFYIRPYRTNFIVVDFAHTPDALENICQGIRDAFPGYYLKVLFGCGGDRDRAKRPIMAASVEKWADEIIVTSDNPRSEDPERIIDDIVAGFKTQNFLRITSRQEAVERSFAQLKEKEILLLAGKGHEDYILIHGIKYPYSDIQEVEKFLARTPL